MTRFFDFCVNTSFFHKKAQAVSWAVFPSKLSNSESLHCCPAVAWVSTSSKWKPWSDSDRHNWSRRSNSLRVRCLRWDIVDISLSLQHEGRLRRLRTEQRPSADAASWSPNPGGYEDGALHGLPPALSASFPQRSKNHLKSSAAQFMRPVSARLQPAIGLEGEETPMVNSAPVKHAAAQVPEEVVEDEPVDKPRPARQPEKYRG
ncbi:MAG: hypothetical protein JWR01_2899 [Subtercola sp.]|nr:hypothetical protein [Subtercola sp.]